MSYSSPYHDEAERRPMLPGSSGSTSDSLWSSLYHSLCFPLDIFDESAYKHYHNTQNSSVASIFLLLNTMIGAGFLVQPAVFQSAGVIATTILYVFFAYATYTGAQILIYLADKTSLMDYTMVTIKLGGISMAILLNAAMVVFTVGAVLTYTLMLGKLDIIQ